MRAGPTFCWPRLASLCGVREWSGLEHVAAAVRCCGLMLFGANVLERGGMSWVFLRQRAAAFPAGLRDSPAGSA
jgi:hypothetical protein